MTGPWTDEQLDDLARSTIWSREAWQVARDQIEQYEMPDDVRDHVYAIVEWIGASGMDAPQCVADSLIRRMRRTPIRATARRLDGES